LTQVLDQVEDETVIIVDDEDSHACQATGWELPARGAAGLIS
jgi:hypothetical protein